jgi:hypothetical protein
MIKIQPVLGLLCGSIGIFEPMLMIIMAKGNNNEAGIVCVFEVVM